MTNYEGTTPPRPDPAPAERGPAWALVLSEVFQAPLVLAALLVVLVLLTLVPAISLTLPNLMMP